MLHARLHAMPVLGEGGRVIGLLTETDFLRYTIRTLALRGCRCDADPTEPRRLASGARIRAIRQRAAS
jgi:CBS-domain-containing membrane protein